ncbi:MAG: hypothetical protein ACK4YP_10105 [Myxococcota bacterium]
MKPPTVRMGGTNAVSYCAGASSLTNLLEPPPPASRVALALLRDGRCAQADEDPTHDGRCKEGAPLTRPPSAVVLDREAGSARMIPLPPGCRPEHLLTAGGVGVLLCTEGAQRAAVHLADGSGTWSHEGSLSLDAGDMTSLVMAPDGTLLLRASWGRGPARRAFVRSPRPLGDPSGWRRVDLGEAFEVRVDVGGALLLFATSDAVPLPSWFTLWRDAPGEPRRALSGRVHVEGSLMDVAIEGRSLIVWQSDKLLPRSCAVREGPLDRDRYPRFILTRRGDLVPLP